MSFCSCVKKIDKFEVLDVKLWYYVLQGTKIIHKFAV